MFYSLNEVEKITGLSRRKIQEYEKCGLSQKPEQEKKKSHRLKYNNSHINELYRLRFYHELDYTIPQIKKEKLTEISAMERKELLAKHITELEDKIKSLQKLAVIGKIMCEAGLEPADIMGNDKIIPFDELMNILKYHELSSKVYEESDEFIEKNIDSDKLNTILSRLKQLNYIGTEIDSDMVQDQIAEIYDAVLPMTNNSSLIFMLTFAAFIPGSANAEEFDEEYGDGFTKFLNSAILYFYSQRKDNPVDKQLYNSFEMITKLYIEKGMPIESDEIMEQVEIAFNFFARTGLIVPSEIISTLKAFNSLLCSKMFLETLDAKQKTLSRISYTIILCAIDYYDKNVINSDLYSK